MSLPLGEGIPPRAGDSSLTAFVNVNYIKTASRPARGVRSPVLTQNATTLTTSFTPFFRPYFSRCRRLPPQLCRTFPPKSPPNCGNSGYDAPTVEYTTISTSRASGAQWRLCRISLCMLTVKVQDGPTFFTCRNLKPQSRSRPPYWEALPQSSTSRIRPSNRA